VPDQDTMFIHAVTRLWPFTCVYLLNMKMCSPSEHPRRHAHMCRHRDTEGQQKKLPTHKHRNLLCFFAQHQWNGKIWNIW